MNIIIQFGFPLLHSDQNEQAATQAMIAVFKMISSREFYGQYEQHKHS